MPTLTDNYFAFLSTYVLVSRKIMFENVEIVECYLRGTTGVVYLLKRLVFEIWNDDKYDVK